MIIPVSNLNRFWHFFHWLILYSLLILYSETAHRLQLLAAWWPGAQQRIFS